jgi:hypothetical protein
MVSCPPPPPDVSTFHKRFGYRKKNVGFGYLDLCAPHHLLLSLNTPAVPTYLLLSHKCKICIPGSLHHSKNLLGQNRTFRHIVLLLNHLVHQTASLCTSNGRLNETPTSNFQEPRCRLGQSKNSKKVFWFTLHISHVNNTYSQVCLIVVSDLYRHISLGRQSNKLTYTIIARKGSNVNEKNV